MTCLTLSLTIHHYLSLSIMKFDQEEEGRSALASSLTQPSTLHLNGKHRMRSQSPHKIQCTICPVDSSSSSRNRNRNRISTRYLCLLYSCLHLRLSLPLSSLHLRQCQCLRLLCVSIYIQYQCAKCRCQQHDDRIFRYSDRNQMSVRT